MLIVANSKKFLTCICLYYYCILLVVVRNMNDSFFTIPGTV